MIMTAVRNAKWSFRSKRKERKKEENIVSTLFFSFSASCPSFLPSYPISILLQLSSMILQFIRVMTDDTSEGEGGVSSQNLSLNAKKKIRAREM